MSEVVHNSVPWDLGVAPRSVVVREELLAITGDFVQSLVLGQFIFWSQKTKDFDEMLVEHLKECEDHATIASITPKRGWIYKAAEQLAEELLNVASRRTVARALDLLHEKGFMYRRKNEDYRWDQRYFYRVNFYKVLTEIHGRGYKVLDYLNAFRFPPEGENVAEFPIGQIGQSSGQIGQSIGQGGQTITVSTIQYVPTEDTSSKNYNKKVGLRPKPEDVTSGESVGEVGETVKVDTAEKKVVATYPIESGNTRNLTGETHLQPGLGTPKFSGGEQADLGLGGAPDAKQDSLAAQITEVFEYWKAVNKITNRRLTKERREKIRARLKTYTVEELKQAIDGAKANDWFNGNNSRGQVYNRLETIFRTDTTTENHIEYAQSNPGAKAVNKSMFAKDGSRGKIGMAEIDDRQSKTFNFKSRKL